MIGIIEEELVRIFPPRPSCLCFLALLLSLTHTLSFSCSLLHTLVSLGAFLKGAQRGLEMKELRDLTDSRSRRCWWSGSSKRSWRTRSRRPLPSYMKRELNQNLSVNAVYYTNDFSIT